MLALKSHRPTRLTPIQQAFARRAIEDGRLHSEEEAVREALGLWEEQGRKEGREITEDSMQAHAAETKARDRARLLTELTKTLGCYTAWRRRPKPTSMRLGTMCRAAASGGR